MWRSESVLVLQCREFAPGIPKGKCLIGFSRTKNVNLDTLSLLASRIIGKNAGIFSLIHVWTQGDVGDG